MMMLKVMAYSGLRLGEMPAMRCEHFGAERYTYFFVQSYMRYA